MIDFIIVGNGLAGISFAEIALKANVKKLMLGHYSSRYSNDTLFLEEAVKIFPNTILANELLLEKL